MRRGRYRELVSDAAPRKAPVEGSAVVLFDAAGRVLLQQRDDDLPPEGYGRWAIPGGGREGDEDPRATAQREMHEETGLRLERLRGFRTYRRAEHPGLVPETLHVFLADDDVDEAGIEVNEGLDFRFWSPEEVAGLRMNPQGRRILGEVFASDKYRGAVALRQNAHRVGVCVIEIDRWGRLLLQLRDDDLPPERYPGAWSIPGGILGPAEAPDAAALREFEEETGQLLEDLKLFRVFRREDLPESLVDVQHVYYFDADIPEELIDVREGQAFRYFQPDELAALDIPPHARHILDAFVASTAYRSMFH